MKPRLPTFESRALSLLLILSGNVWAATSVIAGRVTEAGGKEVPDVAVRVIGISEQRTSSTGEFRIELPNVIQPGDQITLSVARPGWVIKSPPYGQVNVPSGSGQVINVVLIPAPAKRSMAATVDLLDQAELSAPGPYAEKEKTLLDDTAFYRSGSSDTDEPFSLKIHIKGGFRNSAFNSEQFLRGLSKLACLAPACSREAAGGFTKSNEIEWTAYLAFPKRPAASDAFTFSTGPRVWSVKFGNLQWTQYRSGDKKDYLWYGAQASLKLSISDPDWVVLRSARLERLVEGDQYILEAIVENLSVIPIPISHLHLDLSHPRSSISSCAMGDPQVILTLAWERILSQRAEGSEPTAWAQLGKSTVEVYSRARLRGGCSNFSFFAVVPVDVDVAPKALARIDIKIVDLPIPPTGQPPFQRGSVGLTGWQFMSVGVDGALPSEVVVERSEK